MKIAVAGTGYVGLSNAILLSQHNEVVAVDVVADKVDMINHKKSPIVDKEIEEYLSTRISLTFLNHPGLFMFHIYPYCYPGPALLIQTAGHMADIAF